MSSFDREKFFGLLRTRFLGRSFYYFEDTDSSNQRLLELARQGAPEGALVLAESQSAGRGRWGRSWESPPGKNLLFSFLLSPRKGVLSQLAPVFGTALLPVLKMGRLKWPNDVWVGGKKLGGMLIEGDARSLVVGVGLNVNQAASEFSETLRPQATSLCRETGLEQDREPLLAGLLNEAEAAYGRWQSEGFGPFRDAWNKNALFMGESVRAGELQGRLLGIDDDGGLLLDCAGGVEKLVSGEVFALRPVLD